MDFRLNMGIFQPGMLLVDPRGYLESAVLTKKPCKPETLLRFPNYVIVYCRESQASSVIDRGCGFSCFFLVSFIPYRLWFQRFFDFHPYFRIPKRGVKTQKKEDSHFDIF